MGEMVVLKLLEKNREYRDKLRLFDESEKYKKDKSVVSASDLFEMSKRRLHLMSNILKPVVYVLQKDIDIKKIYFSDNDSYGITLNIDFTDDEADYSVGMDNIDFDNQLEFVLDTSNGKYNNLFIKNYKALLSAFKDGLEHEFDKTSRLLSTSKIFNANISTYRYLLESKNLEKNDFLKIIYYYQRSDSEHFDTISSYSDIEEMLNNPVLLKQYMDHIKFYEEDIPKYLIKKR